jgi:hypothetical protein
MGFQEPVVRKVGCGEERGVQVWGREERGVVTICMSQDKLEAVTRTGTLLLGVDW